MENGLFITNKKKNSITFTTSEWCTSSPLLRFFPAGPFVVFQPYPRSLFGI
ncbi:hypothetical protein SAMN05216365_12539 [Porphyromonadaceae bacterium NLAE-zl-C104]|nr:hypothetical protein SAMN05216331_11152 [Porphyromonadaceae bacterium KH3R12]SFS87871.1 hypothetical protein SAMN05216365_12539 [Porphyromonadaceae bacterium NLAE-zl-C104]